MRRDMKKKLVDCYRVRSREKNEDVRRDRRESRQLARRLTEDNELEGPPVKRSSGMRMKGYDRKQFGENLAPLARFLWSCRGQHWDKVYSQISEHCDKNSAVGSHIYEHLWGYVAKDVKMANGKPLSLIPSWQGEHYPITSTGQPGGFDNLYIHPKTGVLLEAPRRKKKPKQEDENVLQVGRYSFAVQVDQVWYLVEVAPQKYEIETKEVETEEGIVQKKRRVPKYSGAVCPARVFSLLPGELRRRLNGWNHISYPRGYCSRKGVSMRVTKQISASLYVKAAKTMSKKEKRRYLPKEMK